MLIKPKIENCRLQALDLVGRGWQQAKGIKASVGEMITLPLCAAEGLYADLALSENARSKLDFIVVGHYARPDVFQLLANETLTNPV